MSEVSSRARNGGQKGSKMLPDWQSLAVAVGGVLLMLAALFFRPPALYGRRIERAINRSIDKLGEAVQHHVDVNAILALTSTIRRDPAILENLEVHLREVYGAALVYRVHAIGSSINELEEALAGARKRYARDGFKTQAAEVERYERILTQLYAQLEAANASASQLHGLRSV